MPKSGGRGGGGTIFEVEAIQLLAQRWSEREPYLKDYSCNVYADRLALIDYIMDNFREELGEEDAKALEKIREMLRVEGQARWLSEYADILTQLGVKVGRHHVVLSLAKLREEMVER